MRRVVTAILVAVVLAVGSTAWAHSETMGSTYAQKSGPCGSYDPNDAYVDGMSHPLRLAAYLAHPVGFALEWLVTRPIHFLISRPQLDRVFGYCENEDLDIRF